MSGEKCPCTILQDSAEGLATDYTMISRRKVSTSGLVTITWLCQDVKEPYSPLYSIHFDHRQQHEKELWYSWMLDKFPSIS